MTDRLSTFGDERSDEIAELINSVIADYLSRPADLTTENLADWCKGLLSLALTTAAPGIWQMAVDTVGEILVAGETDGLDLRPETAAKVGQWILSWERVDKAQKAVVPGEE